MKQPAGNDKKARQAEVSQQKQQDKCNPEHDTGRLGASASQSERARDVKDTTGNPTGKRRDSSRHIITKRGTTFGGILRQLIAENDDQLAEYRSKIEKLEKRRHQLQELYAQLQQEIDEGQDDELSDEVE